MKSRLGTSWVVGTPIFKGVFAASDLGILDGAASSSGRRLGVGAPGVWLVLLSTTNVLDSRVYLTSRTCLTTRAAVFRRQEAIVTSGSDRGCPVDAFAALYYHGPLAVFVLVDPREHAWRGE